MEPKFNPPDLERRINRLAARQYGAVSRGQLIRLGLGAEAIKHRLGCGRLSPLHRGVYALGAGPATKERRWAASVLASGDGAVLSHLSAAALWELRSVDPSAIDVSVRSRNRHSRDGLRVHRPRRLDPPDTTRCRRLPVTTVARTLIDLAEVVSRRSLERALDEAEFLGLLHHQQPQLEKALDRNGGRTGAARLAACMRRHRSRHDPHQERAHTTSPSWCSYVGWACLNPRSNATLGPYEIDFLWRDQRVAVETDGGASHNRASARERDGRRDAWLAAAGYSPLRFTWLQVTERAGEVLGALRAKL